MDRPSLAPIAHTDLDRPRVRWWQGWVPPLTRLPAVAAWAGLRVLRAVAAGGRLLRTDLRRGDDGLRRRVPAVRALAACGVLSLLLPAGLMASAVLLVHRGVRPPPPPPGAWRAGGLYGERVALRAADGARLSAWWVPAKTPRDVLSRGEAALRDRRPAAVLVHDHGHDARQLLPAARGLHEAGINVLLLDTRGAGRSGPSPRTFGELEALDVAAAVAHVRRRPGVDPARVAGWGVGYGAVALAGADVSPALELVVTERPVDPDVDARFVPPGGWFDAARPPCRWAFSLLHTGGVRPLPATPPLRTSRAATPGDAAAAIVAAFDPNLRDRP